jgi:hypothetical protein
LQNFVCRSQDQPQLHSVVAAAFTISRVSWVKFCLEVRPMKVALHDEPHSPWEFQFLDNQSTPPLPQGPLAKYDYCLSIDSQSEEVEQFHHASPRNPP